MVGETGIAEGFFDRSMFLFVVVVVVVVVVVEEVKELCMLPGGSGTEEVL